MLLCTLGTLLAEEPPEPRQPPPTMAQAVGRPLHELFTRTGILPVLLFIVLFKFGDYLASSAGGPLFYSQVGFKWAEIALMSKLFGFFAGVAGAVAAAALIARYGQWRMLIAFGVAQALTNCLFVLLVRYHQTPPHLGLADLVRHDAFTLGPDGMMSWLFELVVGHRSLPLLGVAVFCDNAANTMGAVAFTAFLFSQVRKEYSATQYALFTGLSSLGGNVFFSLATFIIHRGGYGTFWVATSAMALPGLALAWWLMRRQERAEGSPREELPPAGGGPAR
jgi:PAT family beta-lactamase induction signal transducer AmpG